jgi:transcriptional regulator with XRE-family HTH domain
MNKMKQTTLGQVLKRQREALSLSQRELARSVGVKASYVAYIESGRRRPSLPVLRRIADTLGLNGQQVFVLAYPEAKALMDPDYRPGPTSRPEQVWRQFAGNRALLRSHRVTPSELAVLKQVNLHWRLTSPLHFLMVLNAVRQAVQGVEVGIAATPRPGIRRKR